MKETARVSVMCHKPMQGVSFARKTGGSPPLVPEAISCLPKVLSLDAKKTKKGLFSISVFFLRQIRRGHFLVTVYLAF